MFKLSTTVTFIIFIAFLWMLIAPFYANYAPSTKSTIQNSLSKKSAGKAKLVEKPLHSVKLPDFAKIKDVKEKKRSFFNFLAPAIKKENSRLIALHQQLVRLQQKLTVQQLTKQEIGFINELANQYRVKPDLTTEQKLEELVKRVDQVPMELVLVQAANESAWGTSRFARIGLNFFGIWCYKPQCGMVPSGRSGNDRHEVAAFQSVDEAVQHYFYNINTHPAYQVFRDIRFSLRAGKQPLLPKVLASGLLSYSERGEHYVMEISKMIDHNMKYFPSQKKIDEAYN
jgi:Bax protein